MVVKVSADTANALQKSFTTNPLMFLVGLIIVLGVGSVVYQNWQLVDTMVIDNAKAQNKTVEEFAKMTDIIFRWQGKVSQDIITGRRIQNDMVEKADDIVVELKKLNDSLMALRARSSHHDDDLTVLRQRSDHQWGMGNLLNE